MPVSNSGAQVALTLKAPLPPPTTSSAGDETKTPPLAADKLASPEEMLQAFCREFQTLAPLAKDLSVGATTMGRLCRTYLREDPITALLRLKARDIITPIKWPDKKRFSRYKAGAGMEQVLKGIVENPAEDSYHRAKQLVARKSELQERLKAAKAEVARIEGEIVASEKAERLLAELEKL